MPVLILDSDYRPPEFVIGRELEAEATSWTTAVLFDAGFDSGLRLSGLRPAWGFDAGLRLPGLRPAWITDQI